MTDRVRAAQVGLLALALAGCAGRNVAAGAVEPPPAPPAPGAGPAVFRRLTLFEYRNTVRDLLGSAATSMEVPVDDAAGKSGFARGGWLSWVGAGTFLDGTEAMARRAVEELPGLIPCDPVPAVEAEQRACAERFIARFGRRAYRRPLVEGERQALLALYGEQRARVGNEFKDAIRVVLTAMLLSPRFLYHWELPPQAAIKDGPLVRFSSQEMAARLSYLLWASMPDEALFAAADAGKLTDPAEIQRQARRMLRDPRAREGVAEFFVQWLDVTQVPDMHKNKKRFRDFTPELAESMLAETRALVDAVVLDGDGRLKTLLTTTASSVDAGLADLYEVETTASGDERAGVQLDPVQRAGILTRAGFLTAHATFDQSHPVKRGVEMAQRVLCIDLPSPPENVPPPRPPAEGLSTRERFAEHGTNACATACHDLFDPLGFAFEHYDAIGAYRSEDGGKPVDASGEFMADGVNKHFQDAVDLVGFLSGSREVHDCLVKQWLRYALRRREVPADERSLARVQETFFRTSDIRELLVALAASPAFTYRTATPGEPR
jgi:hypothetical protein